MKIEDLKKIGIKNLVLILVAGMLLLFCAIPGKTKENGVKENESARIMSTPTPVPPDENRLEILLSQVEGIGKTKVMIVYQSNAEIEGIVIVAEGARNADVSQYISDAAEALFGIPKHKIIVLPMKTENGSG